MKKVPLKRAIAACAVVTVVCSTVTGTVVYQLTAPRGELQEAYSLINEAQKVVDNKFVGEYDEENVISGIMSGYVASLGDRWSGYMSPEGYKKYLESNESDTVGIGLSVRSDVDEDGNAIMTVTHIAPESPASKQNFQQYDAVTAVDGKTIDELGGFEGATEAVLGEEGKTVTLTVRHEDEKTEDITVTREKYDQIHVQAKMLENNIGYIVIERFAPDTDEQFAAAVTQMQDEGAKSLIFDLRDNPGGQLGALVKSLDLLLPEGRIISLEDKQGNEEVYDSDASEIDLPMAVLVNADSYSAAEFFAAALQSYEKAVVVGEKTVGKGYSQQGFPLSNGGCLNLSTNCYYMPNGESLIDVGVTPDEAVELEDAHDKYYIGRKGSADEKLQNADAQLQAAIKALK